VARNTGTASPDREPIRVCDSGATLPIGDLLPWPNNPRSITPAGWKRLRLSILTLGIYKPFIVWRDADQRWYTLAGHQRVAITRELIAQGHELPDGRVPVIEFVGSRALAERVVLRDNREDGDWDAEMIRDLARDLATGGDDFTGLQDVVETLALFRQAVPRQRRQRKGRQHHLGLKVTIEFKLTDEQFNFVRQSIKRLRMPPERVVHSALKSWSESTGGRP
jgi:hypothetical protein